jgi:ADP-ribose pyrophosphatase
MKLCGVNLLTGKFDNVKVLESRILYEKHGRIIIEDVLEYADGSRHEWVYFKGSGAASAFAGAVAIAAFTEDNKMILTKQYRHPLRKLIYDLPAGGMKDGETPEQAALRELEEETGFTAEKLEWLGRFNWNPSNMSGTVEIFFTRSLKPKGSFKIDEIASVELIDFSSVREKVLQGELVDSALIIATLLVSVKGLLHS